MPQELEEVEVDRGGGELNPDGIRGREYRGEGEDVKVDEVDTCLNSAFSHSDLTWVWCWNRQALDRLYFHHRYVSL